MNRHDRKDRILAGCLSGIAGYVDAMGFLALGGFFVSFMSGNTTRLGVGAVTDAATAALAASLIGAFLVGVMAGSLVGHFAGRRRKMGVLAFVAIVLAIATGLHASGVAQPALLLIAAAMGAENAVFEREGEVSIGVTYMTGTLVKFAQHLTGALLGRAKWTWVPYLGLWLSLAAGAVTGAAVYGWMGLTGMWFAVAGATCLAGAAGLLERQR